MTTKRMWTGMAMAGLLCWSAGSTHAQIIGLQLADTAEMRPEGDASLALGSTIGEDLRFFGGRGTFGVMDGIRVFLDFGVVDMDDDGPDLAGQVGGIISLPLDFISDLGVRAALYGVNGDTRDIVGGDLMFLSSGETLLDGLFIYGGIGADVRNMDAQNATHHSSDHTEVNPAFTAGAIYNITANIAVYAEASHVDSPFFGFGVRLRP